MMRRVLGAATAALLGLATVMGAASLDVVRAEPAAAAPPSTYDEACRTRRRRSAPPSRRPWTSLLVPSS